MTEENPFMALLNQQKDPGELYEHFKDSQKNEELNEASPVIVLDDDEDDGMPIGLTHRQPSFASLHGNIVTKGGEAISNLPEVVEEGDEEGDDDDEPIGLTFRHSSYASLSLGQAIPKGHSKPTTALDILPITEEIPEEIIEESPHKFDPEMEEDIFEEDDFDEEEDSDLNVIIVKQLRDKNTSRWKEMGYEPPKNLIPMVRAASQSQLSFSSGGEKKSVLQTLCEKLPDPLEEIDEIPEEPEGEPHELKEPPKPNPRKRSGSFGMKLGEASASQAMIESIIHENPKTYEVGIEEIAESDDAKEEEENNEEFEEEEEDAVYEEEEEAVLFDRLAEEEDIIEEEEEEDIELQYCNPEIIEEYQKCKKEVDEINKKMEISLELVDRDYLRAANDLDEEWQRPSMQARFNKPSPELRSLRLRLKKSFNFLPIKEIELLQKEVAQLEKKEVKANNQIMSKAYHDADRELKDKFVKKRVAVVRHYEKMIADISSAYDKKVASIKSKIRSLRK